MIEQQMPTRPGYYVADTALGYGGDERDPFGAFIFVLDEDGNWHDYAAWEEDSPPLYLEGIENAVKRFGWKLKRLVVE